MEATGPGVEVFVVGTGKTTIEQGRPGQLQQSGREAYKRLETIRGENGGQYASPGALHGEHRGVDFIDLGSYRQVLQRPLTSPSFVIGSARLTLQYIDKPEIQVRAPDGRWLYVPRDDAKERIPHFLDGFGEEAIKHGDAVTAASALGVEFVERGQPIPADNPIMTAVAAAPDEVRRAFAEELAKIKSTKAPKNTS